MCGYCWCSLFCTHVCMLKSSHRRIRTHTTGCGAVRSHGPFGLHNLILSHPIVNRWLSARFNLLSSAVIGVTAIVCVLTPSINASLAGMALAFSSTILNDVSAFLPSYYSRMLTVPIYSSSSLCGGSLVSSSPWQVTCLVLTLYH